MPVRDGRVDGGGCRTGGAEPPDQPACLFGTPRGAEQDDDLARLVRCERSSDGLQCRARIQRRARRLRERRTVGHARRFAQIAVPADELAPVGGMARERLADPAERDAVREDCVEEVGGEDRARVSRSNVVRIWCCVCSRMTPSAHSTKLVSGRATPVPIRDSSGAVA